MPSSAFAMACSSSDTVRSNDFFLSSPWSSCWAQYSFFWSSSSCSFFRTAIMLSHILMTFSKPPRPLALLPVSASTSKSSPGRCSRLATRYAPRTASSARARSEAAPTCTCRKLAALGSVFLNSSSASSSLRTLMVSASATSSSARVFDRSSHSAAFVAQLLSRFAKNFLSSARVASVSALSSFMRTSSTPVSPICVVFASTVSVRADVSFVLAAIKESYALIAAVSAALASARPLDMVSPICFKIPMISPLCGA
mmetsp:Transcript_93837/g.261240  ORF Transcript_93837/g.261240 Transcript_93837/m.261240 type:complete len:255 (+) Transcript_93837:893-1657(+)